MLTNREWTGRWIAASLAIGLFCSAEAPAGKPVKPGDDTPSYTVYDLHPGTEYFESTARDVNDDGLVVGFAKLTPTEDLPLGGSRAIAWTLVDQTVVPVELDEGPVLPNSTAATSVSVDGAIAGSGDVLDDNGAPSFRGLFWASVAANPIPLEPPAGYDRCWPLGMSDDGSLVVGVAHPDGLSPIGVLWRIATDEAGDPVVTDALVLPGFDVDSTSAAYDVTSLQSGFAEVVGVTQSAGQSLAGGEAVCWTVGIDEFGEMAILYQDRVPTPNSDDSRATAINANGAIAGTSGPVGFVDSLILEPARRTWITVESVQDLNDAGDPLVVGHLTEGLANWVAVLWIAGEAKKLERLARASSFQEFQDAKGINNLGDIVGVGWSDVDENHGFLMIKN